MLESPPTANRSHDARDANAERPSTIRSRVTNGSKMVHGLDGRTASARRFRDLQIAYAGDLGGPENLGEAQRALIAQTATLQVQAERVQAAVLRGEQIDAEQLTRLANSVARNLVRLGLKGNNRRDTTPSLADIIAEHEDRAT
jgi:hypothetical protein